MPLRRRCVTQAEERLAFGNVAQNRRAIALLTHGLMPARQISAKASGMIAGSASKGDTAFSSRIPSKIQGSSGKVRARVQHGMAVLAAAAIRHNFLPRRRTEVGG